MRFLERFWVAPGRRIDAKRLQNEAKMRQKRFRGSKMTSEVARRRRRAALESSEATKEALGGSRTAFRRLNGAVQGDRGGPRRLQGGILEAQGHWSTRDVRETREGRRDAQATGSLRLRILTEVLPGSHTPCTPDKQGAADLTLRASRRPRC